MILATATAVDIKRGKYLLVAKASTGAMTATFNVRGLGTVPLSDFAITNADAAVVVELCAGELIPTITGDLVAALERIS